MLEHTDRNLEDPIEILLVEDNPGDIRLTQEAFKSSSHETRIHPITNGDEAVEWLTGQAASEPGSLPDLVLLDLNLPGQDGHTVLETIRNTPRLEHLPVIILSSSKAGEDINRSYEDNANAYLTKPSDPRDFESVVAAIEGFWFENVVHPEPST